MIYENKDLSASCIATATNAICLASENGFRKKSTNLVENAAKLILVFQLVHSDHDRRGSLGVNLQINLGVVIKTQHGQKVKYILLKITV